MKKLLVVIVAVGLPLAIWAPDSSGRNIPAATNWMDIATGATADPGHNSGLAWGDFDGDGDDDLYLTKADLGEPNVLLMSNGDGSFDVCDVPVLGDTLTSLSASWGDFDHDGDPDLFLANLDGSNRVFRNDGAGGSCWQFTELFSANLALVGETTSAEWVDYDHDGQLEVYVSNRDGNNQLLAGGAGFVDVVPTDLLFPGASQGTAWCDYNGDLLPDMYLVGEDTNNFLYEQQGPSSFIEQTLTTNLSGQGCSWGDYDNDGDFDVFVTHWNRRDILWENQGGGVFAALTSSWLSNSNGQAAAWGDYDNDGFLDLFVANSYGPNELYHNEGGSGNFTLVGNVEPPATDRTIGAAWADVDLDGDLDLYLCNHDASNKLLRNDQSGATQWLRVEVRGVGTGAQSNGSALGAIIKVEAGGLTMWRQVSGSTGYGSQGPLVQHFGLAGETVVDRVTVTWPYRDGNGLHYQSQVTNLAANQTILMVEPVIAASAVPDRQLPLNYTLGRSVTNPFNPQTTLPYSLVQAGRVDLRVYDLNGNLVKVLIAGETLGAGQYSATWQGRDQAGKRVAAGVYFYHFLFDGVGETRRVVLVK